MDPTINFLLTVSKLKDTPRQGWVEHHVKLPESVGDHMYRMSVLCMMCPDPTLDRNRLTKMALCHDMPEALVGDITPAMNVPKDEKYKMEDTAMTQLADLIPDCNGREMRELWLEYEAQVTPESRFLKDMDQLEMVLQAYQYEKEQGMELPSFFTGIPKLTHPWSIQIGQRVLELRNLRKRPTPESQ